MKTAVLAEADSKQWTQLPGLYPWIAALQYVEDNRAPAREMRVSLARVRKGRQLYNIFVSEPALERRVA